MRRRRGTHSVFDEPHLRERVLTSVECWKCGYQRPADAVCPECGAGTYQGADTTDGPDLGIAMEPGSERARAVYRQWYDDRRRGITAVDHWGSALLICLAAAPWAFLGAFLHWMSFTEGGSGLFTVVGLIVIAPVLLEVMKPAALAWAVERRPFYFSRWWTIVLIAAICGLAYGGAEIVIGVLTESTDTRPTYLGRRLMIDPALHTACSALAGLGLARAWRLGLREERRPSTDDARWWLLVAILIHAGARVLAFFSPEF